MANAVQSAKSNENNLKKYNAGNVLQPQQGGGTSLNNPLPSNRWSNGPIAGQIEQQFNTPRNKPATANITNNVNTQGGNNMELNYRPGLLPEVTAVGNAPAIGTAKSPNLKGKNLVPEGYTGNTYPKTVQGTAGAVNVDPQTNNAPAPEQTPTPTPTPTTTAKGGVKKNNKATTNNNGFQLKNADVNLSQYGDDSSAVNYNNQDLRGGENAKYTGEGVKNSNINYDPNATVAGLDPNYLYGWDAQVANSNDAGYIARRNDQIASALYNEGLTSIDDVRNFLESQTGFANSNQNERENTIMSIWKRLGDMTGGEQKTEQPQQQAESTVTTTPEMDLSDETNKTGTIYGKVTDDAGNPLGGITTLADVNSIDAKIVKARQTNYTALSGMNSYDIALSMSAGLDPYGSQAMRDLMQYNPAKYQEVQAELKKIQSMEDVNNIAQGDGVNKTSQTESSTDTINNSIEDRAKSNSNERSYQDTLDILTDKLKNSQTATSATQEMLNLNTQIAEIQEKMEKLPNDAKKYFKSDVPQYVVDAYVANRNSQYQSELNKLQSRYNSALDLYKTELSQKQWEAEMELKQLQLQADLNQQAWQRSYQNQQLALAKQQQMRNQGFQERKLTYDSIVEVNGQSYIRNADGTYTNINDDVAYSMYNQNMKQTLGNYLNMYPDGSVGGQCESFTDNFTEAVAGIRMEGANGGATTAQEKASYVNTWSPAVGRVAVFDYGITDSNGVDWGHTMLVTDYDPTTGIVTLTGSNKSKKDGEYERVYTQQTTLADLQASSSWQGFWDPYMTKLENNAFQSQGYWYASTPMTDTIDTLKGKATTAGQLTTIATAESMYDTMYNLKKDGYLDKLINSSEVEDFLNALDRSKFGKQGDERGSEFLNQLGKYMRNKIKDEEVYHAFNELYTMVEQKLRAESGAAISSSERAMDFQLFLPEIGQSPYAREQKLRKWDDIIYKQFSGSGLKSKDYIPIFGQSEQREIR